jgi:hypothetical protein
MESLPEISKQQETLAQGRTLQVDFSWMKFKSLITEKDDPESKPLYIVDYKAFKPNLLFQSATDNSTFGIGTVHNFHIHGDCEFRDQHIKIKALKRWRTAYTHLSHSFSDTDAPVTMTWTSDSGFKTWDFICLDEQQMPVAKFSANLWTLKNVGNIEFLGEKTATSEAARQEIVITGMTLMYTMALRTSSLFSFFGAFFASTGPIDKEKDTPNAVTA